MHKIDIIMAIQYYQMRWKIILILGIIGLICMWYLNLNSATLKI